MDKIGDLRMDAPPHEIMSDLREAALIDKGKFWEMLADSLSPNGQKQSQPHKPAKVVSPPKIAIKWNSAAKPFQPTTSTATTNTLPPDPKHFFLPGYKPQ